MYIIPYSYGALYILGVDTWACNAVRCKVTSMDVYVIYRDGYCADYMEMVQLAHDIVTTGITNSQRSDAYIILSVLQRLTGTLVGTYSTWSSAPGSSGGGGPRRKPLAFTQNRNLEFSVVACSWPLRILTMRSYFLVVTVLVLPLSP